MSLLLNLLFLLSHIHLTSLKIHSTVELEQYIPDNESQSDSTDTIVTSGNTFLVISLILNLIVILAIAFCCYAFRAFTPWRYVRFCCIEFGIVRRLINMCRNTQLNLANRQNSADSESFHTAVEGIEELELADPPARVLGVKLALQDG